MRKEDCTLSLKNNDYDVSLSRTVSDLYPDSVKTPLFDGTEGTDDDYYTKEQVEELITKYVEKTVKQLEKERKQNETLQEIIEEQTKKIEVLIEQKEELKTITSGLLKSM